MVVVDNSDGSTPGGVIFVCSCQKKKKNAHRGSRNKIVKMCGVVFVLLMLHSIISICRTQLFYYSSATNGKIVTLRHLTIVSLGRTLIILWQCYISGWDINAQIEFDCSKLRMSCMSFCNTKSVRNITGFVKCKLLLENKKERKIESNTNKVHVETRRSA